MEKIRICIGSNDGVTIASTHMGDTRSFLIYDLDAAGTTVHVGQRKNRARDLEHAKSDKMKRILALLEDVDILVAQQKSPNFVKIAEQTRYQPVVVGRTAVEEVVGALLQHYAQLADYVERRGRGERPPVVPEYE